MNGRIKELAEQARKEFLELPTGYIPEQVGMYPQLMEKFAELIVRECIECTKEWRDAVGAESTNDYSEGYVHGCDDVIVEMKTRFGIEE